MIARMNSLSTPVEEEAEVMADLMSAISWSVSGGALGNWLQEVFMRGVLALNMLSKETQEDLAGQPALGEPSPE